MICNLDDSEEPTVQGKYQKSLIIDKYDRKIGIIGVMLSGTDVINRNFILFKLNLTDMIFQITENRFNRKVEIPG